MAICRTESVCMTLEEFTTLRRDELIRFFEARFGRRWRQIVAHQAGLHPRTFQYWKYSRASSLYRRLIKLERWARSVGFESGTDEKVHDRILALQKLKQAAKQEIEKAQSKR